MSRHAKRLLWRVFLCSYLLLGIASAQSKAPEVAAITPEEFSLRLDELRRRTGSRAAIATVWSGQEELARAASGMSLTGVPANTNMTVRIGGISQTFTGTLTMLLVEEGVIRLDDEISQWLPDLLNADQATVGMLLKNLGGYKDYVLDDDFEALITEQPFKQFSSDEIIAYSVKDGEFNFAPGTAQRYSHTEWTILREVLIRATGKTMPELYEEYIFKPWKLSRTGYSETAELPSPVLHAYSSDRKLYEDATFWNPSWTGESGPLYSNLTDLGRWGHLFGSGLLLKPDSFSQLMSRPQAASKSGPYFAGGFVVAGGWFFQNPQFNGYAGAFAHSRDHGVTVVVFTTASENPDSPQAAFEILTELIEEYFPDQPLQMK